jgi:molybdate transport system ATP-binding protein
MLEVDVTVRRGAFLCEARFASDAPIVALFGRSGAGKSTLVHAIAGIVRPERGRIVIGGRTLFDSAAGVDLAPEKRRVGYVFQDGLLFPHLSVRANLAYGEGLLAPGERAVDHARVVALLGLERLLDRRPATLSGGERQRVAIGRALLASPRVLLMDEPLASLDGPRKAEILSYVELLRDEWRLPIVYVSHAIEEVTRLADHLVLLTEGRVAAEGPVAELMRRRDLAPLTGRFEAGAVIEARVVSQDEAFGLATLAFEGGSLVVPNVDALPGEPVRVRVRARDVALALEPPRQASYQNVLPGTVAAIDAQFGALVEVTVAMGTVALVARVTRKAVSDLGLAPGHPVFALVKAVSIDRHAVGFA